MNLNEKLRPSKIEDMVDTGNLQVIKNLLEQNPMGQHFIFFGKPGTGKTTSALMFAKYIRDKSEFEPDIIELNASDERGIDTIRKQIKTRVNQKSSYIFILDEADALTSSAQESMRRIMEQSLKSETPKIFILTCNYLNKIIDPIQSRCTVFQFKRATYEEVENLIKLLVSKLPLNSIKTRGDENEEFSKFANSIFNKSQGDLRQVVSLFQSALSEENKTLSLDVVTSQILENNNNELFNILNQVLDKKQPDTSNIYAYAEAVQSTLKTDVFEIIMDWLQSKESDLGYQLAYNMAVATAEYEYRFKVGSNIKIQIIALFMQFNLLSSLF